MPFGSLWLPVVASAVAVWLLSSILHMALKYHKADYKKLSTATEDAVAAALRGTAPGIYPIPNCPDPAQVKSPEFQKKYADGPVGMLTIIPSGTPNMGRYLGLWFGFCLLTSFVAAYIARHTLSPASDLLEVMRITGAVAFLGYGCGSLQSMIWKGEPWSNAIRSLFDSCLYALATGLAFRFLWPAS